MSDDEYPLPYGWIKQFDRISNHPFWVDTKANPPRSIWTHPYEDDKYLAEHPEVKEKLGNHNLPEPTSPGSPNDQKARRHSFGGVASDTMHDRSASAPAAGSSTAAGPSTSVGPPKKRGFFSKLKDKAIGTKEEREAERQRWAQIQQMRQQQRAQDRALEQAYYNQLYQQEYVYSQDPYYGPPPYGPPMYRRRRGGYGYGYDGYYGGGYGGGGGWGAPLAGGLLGGLLLGDILGGGLF